MVLEPSQTDRIRRVAKYFFDIEVDCISTEEIEKGNANVGIFLHTVEFIGASAHKIKLVEKRSKRKQDISNVKAICDFQRDEPRLNLFPKIYDVEIHSEFSTVLMEYIDGINSSKLRENIASGKIARAIWDLNQMTTPHIKMKDQEELFFYRTKKITSNLKKIDENLYILRALPLYFDFVFKNLINAPIYLCHGDTNFSNMALNKENSNVRLIDFGLLNYDFAGSDFLYLIRMEIDGRFDSSSIINHYSRLSGLDQELVRISALFKAANRSAIRARRYLKIGNSKGVKREIRAFEILVEQALLIKE